METHRTLVFCFAHVMRFFLFWTLWPKLPLKTFGRGACSENILAQALAVSQVCVCLLLFVCIACLVACRDFLFVCLFVVRLLV